VSWYLELSSKRLGRMLRCGGDVLICLNSFMPLVCLGPLYSDAEVKKIVKLLVHKYTSMTGTCMTWPA
jgi:hypothetical protein